MRMRLCEEEYIYSSVFSTRRRRLYSARAVCDVLTRTAHSCARRRAKYSHSGERAVSVTWRQTSGRQSTVVSPHPTSRETPLTAPFLRAASS